LSNDPTHFPHVWTGARAYVWGCLDCDPIYAFCIAEMTRHVPLHPVFYWSSWGLENFLPRLTSNLNPPE
jgi:hypothetical protein